MFPSFRINNVFHDTKKCLYIWLLIMFPSFRINNVFHDTKKCLYIWLLIMFPSFRINNVFVALKEIRLQEEEGIPFTAIREGNMLQV